MNQDTLIRLEKAAEKMVLQIPASLDSDEFTSLFNEKFAESIVGQMLEITGAHTEVFQTDRDKAVIEHIKQSIKTHFGVEE